MITASLTTDEVLQFLAEPRQVALCGHVNSDGDSLGSGLALAALLRMKGHTVTNLLAKAHKPPELYNFFANYEFVPAAEYAQTPDLFIAVDSPKAERLADALEVLERARDTLVIDHHPDYSDFANHYYGDPTASATGVLIWRLLKASEVSITPQMAEYCYVALMTDTGRFAFQNTNSEAFAVAGEMISCGVDPADASMRVYDSRSLGSLTLDARLIDRITYAAQGGVVYSWVTEEDFQELDVSRDETEGLPTILRSVKGTEVAILLRQEHDRVRVNLRAKASCDVGEFARRFGGGGHKAAAGFTLMTTLEEAKTMILKEADVLVC